MGIQERKETKEDVLNQTTKEGGSLSGLATSCVGTVFKNMLLKERYREG